MKSHPFAPLLERAMITRSIVLPSDLCTVIAKAGSMGKWSFKVALEGGKPLPPRTVVGVLSVLHGYDQMGSKKVVCVFFAWCVCYGSV